MSHDFQTMLDGSPSVKPKVEILKPFHVSRILNKDEWCHALIGWLAPKRLKERPRLIYQGSRDGWTPSALHDEVSGKGPFLLVVKDLGSSHVLGAYLNVPWPDNYCSFEPLPLNHSDSSMLVEM